MSMEDLIFSTEGIRTELFGTIRPAAEYYKKPTDDDVTVSDFIRNEENPFLKQAIESIDKNIVKKYKSSTNTDEKATLVAYDPNTSEILGHTRFIRQIEVDEAQFAKLYLANFGAFFDWGLDNDLFISKREQARPVKLDQYYVVRLYLDELTNRLAASTKLNKFLTNEDITLVEHDEVDILICERTDLGWNAIINNQYKGLIYRNEVFRPLKLGDKLKAYVKLVRPDNKIDLSLTRLGYAQVETSAELILRKLKLNGGFMAVGDESTPEAIMHHFQMSKKTFKKSIGLLYKQQLIDMTHEGIKLIH